MIPIYGHYKLVIYLRPFSGYQLMGNFQEKVKQVGKNLIDILPVIELCSSHKTDKDSIIPFAKSKVDLLFLASEDDGVTTSVDQVNILSRLLFLPKAKFENKAITLPLLLS